MDQKNLTTLIRQLDPAHFLLNEPLSKHTTLKIGGPADIFYSVYSLDELKKVAKIAYFQDVPLTILGRGSNVLVSDLGIRGLVIENRSKMIKIEGEKPVHEDKAPISPRWQADSLSGTFKYNFTDLDYDESNKPRITVTLDSGVDLPFAINFLISKGITGLQWYAGIPGTIGGALYNNIHGGTHFISEVISEVLVIDQKGTEHTLTIKDIGVDYDKTRFHESGEIILQGKLTLFKGDPLLASYTAREWAKRKQIQPRNSAGCAFANISPPEQKRLNLPTSSIGYIVEHVLGMTNIRKGGARISPQHYNFIVNDGNATSQDYLDILKMIYHNAKDKLGIKLLPEIILLGFDNTDIEEFILHDQHKRELSHE